MPPTAPKHSLRIKVRAAFRALVPVVLFLSGITWSVKHVFPSGSVTSLTAPPPVAAAAAEPGSRQDRLVLSPYQKIQAELESRPRTPANDVAGVARVLARYTRDNAKASRIAEALVYEGKRHNIAPALLVGVLLTENPWLNPSARSGVGAVGLMQVMPFHRGRWGCASSDLVDIESNICHGVQILADNIKRFGSVTSALQHYNGCVRGSYTPDCNLYSSKVLRYADVNSGIIRSASAPLVASRDPFSRISHAVARPLARIAMSSSRKRARGSITLPKDLLVEE